LESIEKHSESDSVQCKCSKVGGRGRYPAEVNEDELGGEDADDGSGERKKQKSAASPLQTACVSSILTDDSSSRGKSRALLRSSVKLLILSHHRRQWMNEELAPIRFYRVTNEGYDEDGELLPTLPS
jgi:hypothetical protein